MFSAFVFVYLLAATMFFAYVLKHSKSMAEPATTQTHPTQRVEIVELFPDRQEERKAA
jgi:hypothetical protein